MDHSRHNLVPALLLLLVAALLLTGCASPSTSHLELKPSNYDTAFDATIAALRDEQFLLDRVDRRLGVITTKPRTASSALEPWKGDNSTPMQALESTLQYERRIVRVEFDPLVGISPDTGPSALPPFGQVSPAAPFFIPADYHGTLIVNVRCFVERSHRPGLQVPTVAVRHSEVTVDPALKDRGMSTQFWEPVARDGYMETRLRRRIANNAGALVQLTEPTPDTP